MIANRIIITLVLLLAVLYSKHVLSDPFKAYRPRIERALGISIDHIDIQLAEIPDQFSGVACSSTLILINKKYWETELPIQKLSTLIHEVAHTQLVEHDRSLVKSKLKNITVRRPRSLMYPSSVSSTSTVVWWNQMLKAVRDDMKRPSFSMFSYFLAIENRGRIKELCIKDLFELPKSKTKITCGVSNGN